MKKIKYIVYIAILSLLVVSCEDNTDSVTNPGMTTTPEEVKVGFTDDNMSAQLIEGQTTSFRIGMNAAVNGTVTVSFNVTSSDGTAEVVYPSAITLNEGESAKYFDVTPKDDGVDEVEDYTIEITGVDVDYNNSSTVHYVYNGDTSRTFGVISPSILTTVGDLTFNFTWTGSGNDLDCRILDSSGANVDTGYSTTPGETVTLGSAAPDGDYTFTMRPWTIADASIDYTLDVVAPTETKVYTGNFMNLTGFWAVEPIVLEIKKVTFGTNVAYSINQL